MLNANISKKRSKYHYSILQIRPDSFDLSKLSSETGDFVTPFFGVIINTSVLDLSMLFPLLCSVVDCSDIPFVTEVRVGSL